MSASYSVGDRVVWREGERQKRRDDRVFEVVSTSDEDSSLRYESEAMVVEYVHIRPIGYVEPVTECLAMMIEPERPF